MSGSQMDPIGKTKLESLFGKLFIADFAKFMETSALVKKDDGLGLEIKNMIVLATGFQSPFTGELLPGDIIIGINGQHVSEVNKFVKVVQATLTSPTAKITLKFIRLKKRINRPPKFPAIQKTDGYIYETAVVYNFRGVFQLGLDVREVEGRVVICHTVEHSLADIFLSSGAFITDVDGENITSCTMLNERIKKSLEIRNYALVTLEIPNTDYLKNMIRNKISAATKEVSRIHPVPNDAKAYALEGLAAIKTDIEPVSIFVEEEKSKITSVRADSDRLMIQKSVLEVDVPSSWNSYLFVKIPPAKSVETESVSGANPS